MDQQALSEANTSSRIDSSSAPFGSLLRVGGWVGTWVGGHLTQRRILRNHACQHAAVNEGTGKLSDLLAEVVDLHV